MRKELHLALKLVQNFPVSDANGVVVGTTATQIERRPVRMPNAQDKYQVVWSRFECIFESTLANERACVLVCGLRCDDGETTVNDNADDDERDSCRPAARTCNLV